MDVAATPLGRILVATDLSQAAGAALSRAAQLSREHGAGLTVLHVLPDELSADVTDQARRSLQAHVVEFAGSVAVEVVLRRGTVAYEIIAEGLEWGADLLVVGAHGEHRLIDVFVGSTAENVVRMSPVPVLLVKRPAETPYRTVILAVDTSAPAAEAARFGCALTPAAHHILVHACTVVGESLIRASGANDEQIEALRRASTEQARDHIAHLTDTLAPRPSRVLVTPGHPPTRLVELTRSYAADMVVVGTGARSAMSYVLLGSVAQHVMRESRSDVLVVRGVEA